MTIVQIGLCTTREGRAMAIRTTEGWVPAAATWDPVVTEIFAEYFESEEVQRDRLTAQVDSVPLRILDVACGTGESTLAWRRRFPRAQITAIDVSPYMLAVAERKLADDRTIEE